jgi:hypothetical protein
LERLHERNQNTQQGTTAFDLGVGFVLISNDTIHERGVTIYSQGEIWFSWSYLITTCLNIQLYLLDVAKPISV